MKFKNPIIGQFIKRYKRFFADFELEDGKIVTAHCPNTGSMKGILNPGSLSLLTYNPNPKRKLDYTWQMIQSESTWVGINTLSSNKLVEEALTNKIIAQVSSYDSFQSEVWINDKSRCDFFLNDPPCFLEVKHVHLKLDDHAAFPDSITERGQKHLQELIALKNQGTRAIVIYVVQREDLHFFRTAHEIDPAYDSLFRQSIEAGVEHYAYRCHLDETGINIKEQIPIQDYPSKTR